MSSYDFRGRTSSGMSQLSSGIPINSSPAKRNSSDFTLRGSSPQRHKYSYSSSSSVTMSETEDESDSFFGGHSFFIRRPSYYRFPK